MQQHSSSDEEQEWEDPSEIEEAEKAQKSKSTKEAREAQKGKSAEKEDVINFNTLFDEERNLNEVYEEKERKSKRNVVASAGNKSIFLPPKEQPTRKISLRIQIRNAKSRAQKTASEKPKAAKKAVPKKKDAKKGLSKFWFLRDKIEVPEEKRMKDDFEDYLVIARRTAYLIGKGNLLEEVRVAKVKGQKAQVMCKTENLNLEVKITKLLRN